MSLVNRAIPDVFTRSRNIVAAGMSDADVAAAITEAAERVGGLLQEQLFRRAAAEFVVAAIAG
jgi:hypothetical protein